MEIQFVKFSHQPLVKLSVIICKGTEKYLFCNFFFSQIILGVISHYKFQDGYTICEIFTLTTSEIIINKSYRYRKSFNMQFLFHKNLEIYRNFISKILNFQKVLHYLISFLFTKLSHKPLVNLSLNHNVSEKLYHASFFL